VLVGSGSLLSLVGLAVDYLPLITVKFHPTRLQITVYCLYNVESEVDSSAAPQGEQGTTVGVASGQGAL